MPQHNRYIDIPSGTLMVVTDLHGDRAAFDRYVATFFSLYEHGEANRLIFLGDLLHGYGDEADDASLYMIRRVMELQANYSADTITMLLGNHELPHIYGVSLAKGDIEFTPRFERAMRGQRNEIIKFLKRLPFVVRTAAGVLLCHAGPDQNSINRITRLRTFDHDDLLRDADDMLAAQANLDEVYQNYAELSGASYADLAREYLDVDGPNDPRYPHLLRALFISERDHRFAVLWDFLFTQNERGMVPAAYEQIARRYLDAMSLGATYPQAVCVSGHITVPDGGYKVINDYHFRLASATHATPREAGGYLLFDAQKPIKQAADLVPHFHKVF
ncbi:MAG: metallophosphoesterase [Anaerolineales bacterium]